MKKIVINFIIYIFVIAAPLVAGTTYYVDASNGNNLYNGLSPTAAWKTIAKVTDSTFSPGDSILFKRGETWREQLIVPSSGSAGRPITFGAYGTGIDPIISGANLINPATSWTQYSGNVWQAVLPTYAPLTVFFNNIAGHKQTSTDMVDSDKDWCWASNILYVYSTSDPSGLKIETGQRRSCIETNGKNYLTIEYLILDASSSTSDYGALTISGASDNITAQQLTVTRNCFAGIYSRDTSNTLTIRNNTMISGSGVATYGIRLNGGNDATISGNRISDMYNEGICCSASAAAHPVTISHNVISNCSQGSGIKVDGDLAYVIIDGNEVSTCGLCGILVIGNNCTIQNNVCDGNGTSSITSSSNSGISVYDVDNDDSAGHNNIVRYNICSNTLTKVALGLDGNGIIIDYGDDNQVYYNICYGNDGRGIVIHKASYNLVYNNVSYNNGQDRSFNHTDDTRSELSIWTASGSGNMVQNNIAYATQSYVFVEKGINSSTTVNYNCYYSTSGKLFRKDDTEYETMALWRMGSGRDANSINSNPLFVSTLAPDFHLQKTSPCIEAGVDVGLTRDYGGNPILGANPSIGAYEYAVVTTDPLRASIDANPVSGTFPLAVIFTGNATGGTPPYAYNWNFGDGSSSLVQNPSHTYSAVGNYVAILTVTDSRSEQASATITISVGTTTTAILALSAETGAPAPGEGGTTNPMPGNHSFSIGSSVQVESIPNSDYRFSKWSGDVIETSMFNVATTITMNSSKSLLATFCAKCADVNGDLKITPSDAQLAFDIYLGRIQNPTWCELENSDVNCNGTKLVPMITPADAQIIFNKYLKKGTYSGDCSGNSRTALSSQQNTMFSNASLTIDGSFLTSEGDILIPIIIESSSEIGAFGFDLAFPSDVWTYVGLEGTELTSNFDQLDANVVSYQASGPGQSAAAASNDQFLRVGGYKTSDDKNASVGVLVTLVFRAKTGFVDPSEISIIAAYDDIQKASIYAGSSIRLRNNERRVESRRPADQRRGKAISRKFDF